MKHFNHLFAFSVFWGMMQYFWPIHCIYLNYFSTLVCNDCVIFICHFKVRYIYQNFIISYDINVFREMQIYRSIWQRGAATEPFFSRPGSGQGLRSTKRPDVIRQRVLHGRLDRRSSGVTRHTFSFHIWRERNQLDMA